MLPTPKYNNIMGTYYYSGQFEKLLIQFMNVFAHIKVRTGKNDMDRTGDFIDVTIKHGSMDRVVAAIKTNNNNNTPLRLPAMAAKITGIEYAADRAKGTGTTSRKTVLERGKVFPDDLKVVYSLNPIPYDLTFELNILTSNMKHHFEIIEQICLVFNPTVQLQTSDAVFDMSKITQAELENISIDENYPSGQDRRLIAATLQFSATAWVAAPLNIRDEIVKSIQIRLALIGTEENTKKVANDVGRELPPYQTLVDIDDYDIPD